MTRHLLELDASLSTLHELDQRLPEIAVDYLTLASEPAVLQPLGPPLLAEAVHQICRVGHDREFVVVVLVDGLERCTKLHALVGGGHLRPGPRVVSVLTPPRPATDALAATAVGVDPHSSVSSPSGTSRRASWSRRFMVSMHFTHRRRSADDVSMWTIQPSICMNASISQIGFD